MINLIILALFVAAVAFFVYAKVTDKDPKVLWASVVSIASTAAVSIWTHAVELWDKLV